MRKLSVLVPYLLVSCGLLSAAGAGGVGQRTLQFVDPTRQRPLVTEIWYPTSERPIAPEMQGASPFIRSATVRDGTVPPGKLPAVLLSHGTGGNRLTLEWLAFGLAEAGYVVIAVDHWGNTFDTAQPEYFLKPWERPQDLSFVLNEVSRNGDFASVLDLDRIGAVGFSLGGYTALALAGCNMDAEALYRFADSEDGERETNIPELPMLLSYLQQPGARERLIAASKAAPPLYDSRVKAVVALAPAIGPAFTNAQQCAAVTVPVLIVVGASDVIAPPRTNAERYHAFIPHSRLQTLPGEVGHYAFLNEAGAELRAQLPQLFIDAPLVSRKEVHRAVIQLTLQFLRDHLSASSSHPVPSG